MVASTGAMLRLLQRRLVLTSLVTLLSLALTRAAVRRLLQWLWQRFPELRQLHALKDHDNGLPHAQGRLQRGSSAPRFLDYAAELPQWLSTSLQREGFDWLTRIQRRVLPLALAGKDVVGIAPTGSGKTLAFLIPALVHVAGRPAEGSMVLVLAPTRELVQQIAAVAESLVRPSRSLQCVALYGGARREDQLQTLRAHRRVQLVVSTPGRCLDFTRVGALRRRATYFVLDEGDRMLDEGFEPDVTAIAAQICAGSSSRQTLLFSATWPCEVEAVAARLLRRHYHKVAVDPAEEATEQLPGKDGISLPPRQIHQVVEVVGWHRDAKLPLLLRHLQDAFGREHAPGKALIFVSKRLDAEELGAAVAQHFGLERCGVMHGGRKQEQREATLRAFREGRLRALVCTDVLGRGVDIAEVTHVVIFDFPGDIETYIHRVGRTGRNGQKGMSVAFFEPQPWYPDLAHELAEVLRSCGQEVPAALCHQEAAGDPGQWAPNVWPSEPTEATGWPAAGARGEPPELDDETPPLASAEDLGEWDADGTRVWGYSANGGASEQGRLELRAGGALRTTWGWGVWALRPADTAEPNAAASRWLALTWNGVTDVVSLRSSGQDFELVSRNGRPASSYKKKTLGHALPGESL